LAQLQKLRAEIVEAAPNTVAPFALFASELDSLVEACGAQWPNRVNMAR
jgi:glutamate dehydrogenase